MKRVVEYTCVVLVSTQLLGASSVRAEEGLRGQGQISFILLLRKLMTKRKNKMISRPFMLWVLFLLREIWLKQCFLNFFSLLLRNLFSHFSQLLLQWNLNTTDIYLLYTIDLFMYYICEKSKIFFQSQEPVFACLGVILPLLRRHGTERPKVARLPRPCNSGTETEFGTVSNREP